MDTQRQISFDFAKLEESCLEFIDNIIALKRSRSYYYQVQMQLVVTWYSWCDFFLCIKKDSFSRKYTLIKHFGW